MADRDRTRRAGDALRARTALAAVAVAIGLLGAAATPALAGREATAIYVGANDSLRRYVGTVTTSGCGGDLADGTMQYALGQRAGAGAGGYCFWLKPDESQVRVRIVDASGLPIGGTLYFGNGELGGSWMGIGERPDTVFCGRTVVTIPRDATQLIVQVGGDSEGQAHSEPSAPYPALPCGPSGGAPTAGTIVAFFS